MTPLTNLLKKGNSKLGKDVYTFSLPPIKTCTPSEECKQFCYARKGFFRMKNVIQSLEKSYQASKKPDFTDKIITEIQNKQMGLVRIHVSGDFYTDTYVKKWILIASSCLETKFLAFTKRQDLKIEIEQLAALSNVTILESLDNSIDHKGLNIPSAVIEGCKYDTPSLRECTGTCQQCDYSCWVDDNVGVRLPLH